MHRLHRLSFVTATLILLLISPLQIAVNPLGMKAVLAKVQTAEQRKEEMLRLYELGVEQLNTSQFREALATFLHVLVIVREIGERQFEGTTLNQIGEVYRRVGQ